MYLHGIHQLSSTANSAHIGWNPAKSAVLPSRWIPWRYLYDFEKKIKTNKIFFFHRYSQYAEQILNKIAKTGLTHYAGLKSMLQRLCCLAGGFHAHEARILKKIYSESLKRTL